MADTGQLPPPIKLGRVIGWRREVIAIVSRPGHNDVMAHVVLRPEAGKQLDGLPPRIKDRMYKLLARLESWPSVSGAKPLRGNLAGRFRMRTGDYRLQFRVEGQTVTVERIGHRDGFYGG
jgi:mRNA-degrading endonuclease RelE of RelBE toxin-antitoxin system